MDDYNEEQEKASRDYRWQRKLEIYTDIEELWLSYLQELDYPNIKFLDYVARHYDPPLDEVTAGYFIWIWKFVKGFSVMHLN